MTIEVKTVKLTKSKILQMDYIGVPKGFNYEVLGWVNLDKNRKYVIIKFAECYYRADYITEVEKEVKCCQFNLDGGGYEWPDLTNVRYTSHNRGTTSFVVNRNEEENIKWYNHLIEFKRKTEQSGQIYY